MNYARASMLALVALPLFLTSCVTPKSYYHGGVEPVSPVPAPNFHMKELPKVASLQPTLSWKSSEPGQTDFDIVIYTGIPSANSSTFAMVGYYVPAVQVYQREGISGLSHHVEQPLAPDTVYVWSVRTHNGTAVGPWSTYGFEGRGGAWGNNLWWSFRTPRQ